jgi:protein-disulfide isomerase
MTTAVPRARVDRKVRVIVFEDLQCSDCAAFRRILDETLLPRYGTNVEFEHRDFPLEKHAWARKAAIVARYFSEIDSRLGNAYRRYAMADLKTGDFDGRLVEFARIHSIDAQKTMAALDDPRLRRLVENDLQEGIARGVTRTPTVFIDGKPFVETFSIEEISLAVDRALMEPE